MNKELYDLLIKLAKQDVLYCVDMEWEGTRRTYQIKQIPINSILYYAKHPIFHECIVINDKYSIKDFALTWNEAIDKWYDETFEKIDKEQEMLESHKVSIYKVRNKLYELHGKCDKKVVIELEKGGRTNAS